MVQTSPHRLVEDLSARLESLEPAFARAYWDSQVDASPRNSERRAELELELRRAKGDPDAFAAVQSAVEDGAHDSVLLRELDVLRLILLANQADDTHRRHIVELSSAIETEFAAARAHVDGRALTDNEVREVLRVSDDEDERRDVWVASKQIGRALAPRLLDLVRLRNEVALAQGYSDHFRFALELQELPEDRLFDLFDRLEHATRRPFETWKRNLDDALSIRFGTDRLQPWHYSDPFFQSLPPEGGVSLDAHLRDESAPELATKTYRAWGIDLTSVMERSDLYPRDGKSQHAFCLDVDRTGDDVRILANVVPGEHWAMVMLHESGHAAYDVSIDRRLPYVLRRPPHIFVTEAIAILSDRLVRHPRWLVDVAGVAASDADALSGRLRRAARAEDLLFARWAMVVTHFERALYSDPEQDLDALWWDLVARFQLIAPPDDPPPGAWASKIHLASSPVYYQNYLLGEVLASQLEDAARRETGGGLVGSKAAGDFLVERVFRPGAMLRWRPLVEEATGAPLSPDAFIARVTG